MGLFSRKKKEDPTMWIDKGISLFELDKFDEAIACYDKALEIDPKNAAAHGNMGMSLDGLGKYPEAIDCFDRALEIVPNDGGLLSQKGGSLNRLGKYRESIICYDKAIEFDPKIATSWSFKADALVRLDKFDESIICFDKALEIEPNDGKVWEYKADILFELGKFEEAITCYDKALEIDPKDNVSWKRKGMALHHVHRYAQAITCFDKAIEIEPNQEDVEVWKGRTLDHLEKFEEAITCYDKILEINPNSADVLSMKGCSLNRLEKYAESIDYFDKAIEIDPNHADAWTWKGYALDYLEKFNDAITCFDKAIEIDPNQTEAQTFKDITLENISKNNNIPNLTNPLKVSEAYTRDVGRGVARIGYDAMDRICANTGDIIEIKKIIQNDNNSADKTYSNTGEIIENKEKTVAICLPLYPSDEEKNIIRFDGLIRNNSRTTIGDKITYRKIKSVTAEKVIVTPLEPIPPIDERYLADTLENIPLIKDDNVMVPYFGGRLTFQVTDLEPIDDVVVVTLKTVFQIKQNEQVEEQVEEQHIEFNEKICQQCQTGLVWPDINACYYCQKNYCMEHRLPENHECPKVIAAKHIKNDYLRKKGVNITTGRFAVICNQCGYTSEYAMIEKVSEIRKNHINQNHCKSDMVKLRQHDEDVLEDEKFIQKTHPINQDESWMYQCLENAKQIVLKNHNAENMSEFFSESTFSISIQTDMEYAYGYVNGTFPFYRIGIHKALEENTPESYKMVTVILIHEILHALHGDWSESKVSSEENRLANLGSHFDAIRDLEILYLSGKMRLCGK
jgi:tetratricopeptide (TPR) repeat protein